MVEKLMPRNAARKVRAGKSATRKSAANKSVAGEAPAKTATGRAKSPMSPEHKQALALGREESRAVRRYLEALEAHKPKRGRKRTPDSIEARLHQIEVRLPSADALSRVHLAQERLNLESELTTGHDVVDLGPLEEEFIKAARGYGERKGLSYSAWRASGVDAKVLRHAGIRRTRA